MGKNCKHLKRTDVRCLVQGSMVKVVPVRLVTSTEKCQGTEICRTDDS